MRGMGYHTQAIETQDCPLDNTSDFVMSQVNTWHRIGLLIHVESAREIASWWQSPGSEDKGFTAFASTGAILTEEDGRTPMIVADIDRELRSSNCDSQDRLALEALKRYVVNARPDDPK